jgi:hypothetical protein
MCGVLFSGLQLCLLYGYTFGLPDVAFATGDAALERTVQLMSFMPMAVMFLVHVPDGAEATVYALLTTWLNVATEISFAIGTLLECALPDVDNRDIEAGNWGGLIDLVWITSVIRILPILFLWTRLRNVEVLPNGRREVRAQFDKDNKNWWGAFSFASIFISSLVVSVAAAVIAIYYPNLCLQYYKVVGIDTAEQRAVEQ